MTPLLIFVARVTNRLRYAMELVLTEQLGFSVEFTTQLSQFEQFTGPKFVYGNQSVPEQMFFKASSLLFEREIVSQELRPFQHQGITAFFPVYQHDSALPFDPFAASFYLVSRYEEYLPFVRDQHGRFEATSSVLHATSSLRKPLINYWCIFIAEALQGRFNGLAVKKKVYQFKPTYDIDAAWAYRHKGFYRSSGAYLKDILKSDWDEIRTRTSVLLGKQPDPFDTFEFQLQLQETYKLRPAYFILFADYALNDKNISVRSSDFKKLILKLGDYAEVGIHPSYNSFMNKQRLRLEINRLSAVLNRPVTISRQHFLRMNLPATYHNLIDLDITDDFTMGYASQPGFRAGIADSFQFYDLDNDMPTPMRVHPFQLMDGTLRDYLTTSPEEGLCLAAEIIQEVKAVNGTFVSLWHNESLSDQKRWKGWLGMYKKLVETALP